MVSVHAYTVFEKKGDKIKRLSTVSLLKLTDKCSLASKPFSLFSARCMMATCFPAD